jgi:Ca2+-dependent lipid-binding protein
MKTPFNLNIIIHKAEDLAIADTFSSDPYVVLHVGENSIGQTKVKPNNLNPIWEEIFSISLIHVHQNINLKIIDKDDYGEDDVMGQVNIDLINIKIGEINKQLYNIEKAGDMKPKGNLIVSIEIIVNDLIQIIKKPSEIETRSPLLIQMLEEELNNSNVTDPVIQTMHNLSKSMTNTLFTRDLVKDLLLDIQNISQKNIENIKDNKLNFTNRKKISLDEMFHLEIKSREYKSATFIDLINNTYKKITPYSTDIGISFVTEESGYNPMLVFPNKYSMWVWTRWLRLAFEVWNGKLSTINLFI